jgi:hypothetical protein
MPRDKSGLAISGPSSIRPAWFDRLVKAFKLILFDITLLILFVVALIRIIRVELGW